MKRQAGLVVAGATGYIGSNLLKMCRDLVPLVGVTRRQLRDPGASDVIWFRELETATLPSIISPADSAIVHVAGRGREVSDGAIIEGNVDTTKALINAAQRWGISRIVYMSGFGIPRTCQSVYFRAKAQAEKLIRDSGLSFGIVRCSYILGGADELVPNIRRAVADGSVAIPGDGSYRMNPVSIYDVTALLFALATRDRAIVGTHDFLGDVVSYAQLVRDIVARIDPAVPISSQPPESVIRSAMLDARPALSLTQVGILFSDLYAEKTDTLCNIRPMAYPELLESLEYEERPTMTQLEWCSRYGFDSACIS
jgi:nucleoside-diphosphate-sugar epimerase